MSEHSPLSPEARAAQGKTGSEEKWFAHLDAPHQLKEVARRVAVGVYSEGFVHAGNFAYLALLAVFAFFIAAAAIVGAFGESETGANLLYAFFSTVPRGVGDALREPIQQAMSARSGPLLWGSALVGLWTTTSLIESIRDVLNRAYGTQPERHFWEYRLGSIMSLVGAVLLTMLAFSAQVLVAALEELVTRFLPGFSEFAGYFAWGRLVPFLVLFASIYFIFRGLTPRKYRLRRYAKWPGAAFVSLWWLGCTSLLPWFVSRMANYDLTYGSLAGVMVTLIFFYLIGLGLVTGAQLNAALANANGNGLETPSDNAD